jgi:hypothetical protein
MGKQEKRELSKLWSAATWRRFVIRNASLTRAVTKRSQVAALQSCARNQQAIIGAVSSFHPKSHTANRDRVVRIRGKMAFSEIQIEGLLVAWWLRWSWTT